MLQAPAVEIELDGARIEAVRVAVGAGQEVRVVARQVVLAGGGIENARLLLASRQATPAGLGNAHDQVGRCFMEHLFHDDVAFFEPSGLLPALRYYGRRTTGPSGSFKAVIVPTAATLAQAGLAHHCFKLAIPWKRLPAIAAALRWREVGRPCILAGVRAAGSRRGWRWGPRRQWRRWCACCRRASSGPARGPGPCR